MRFQDYADPERRFALREMEPGDLVGIEAIDRAVFFPYVRHITGPKAFLEQAIASQADEQRTLFFVAITPPEDRRRMIGFLLAGVREASAEVPVDWLEIGYALLPAFQRRGIARSSLLAFLPKVLPPGITEVRATADPDNPPSLRLLQACGFERFGEARPSKYLGDPDNPAHYESGVLQFRPRATFRIGADAFR